MQAIITKYLPPTTFKGARIKATTTSGLSVTLSWMYGEESDRNHEIVLRALCAKYEWKGLFVSGHLKDGSMVWVRLEGVGISESIYRTNTVDI